MSSARAYCRCNSGHYFQGQFWPFDGWSSSASRALTRAMKQLTSEGEAISIRALRKHGVSGPALERVLVIEFGSSGSAFEALSAQEVVVQGKARPLIKFGKSFK